MYTECQIIILDKHYSLHISSLQITVHRGLGLLQIFNQSIISIFQALRSRFIMDWACYQSSINQSSPYFKPSDHGSSWTGLVTNLQSINHLHISSPQITVHHGLGLLPIFNQSIISIFQALRSRFIVDWACYQSSINQSSPYFRLRNEYLYSLNECVTTKRCSKLPASLHDPGHARGVGGYFTLDPVSATTCPPTEQQRKVSPVILVERSLKGDHSSYPFFHFSLSTFFLFLSTITI